MTGGRRSSMLLSMPEEIHDNVQRASVPIQSGRGGGGYSYFIYPKRVVVAGVSFGFDLISWMDFFFLVSLILVVFFYDYD